MWETPIRYDPHLIPHAQSNPTYTQLGYDDYINPLTTGLQTLASIETGTVATGPFAGPFTVEIYNEVNFTQYEYASSPIPHSPLSIPINRR